jgi:tripartite-type tricarboxylate transporter receptor subunit TctC
MDMKLTVRRSMCMVAASCMSAAAGTASAQQDYPTRSIRMIVGVAPGGATDILARAIGIKMGENLRQQVIVDNRPGANHIIGSEMTAKSPPDGYTIQMVPEGFVINPAIYNKLPFDTLRDFSAVAIVAQVPNVLVVHPSLPVRTVKEFITLARARPGQLSYGTSGVGAPSHMSAELFKVYTRVEYTHIPYKGQAPAVMDLLGGHLQFAFPSIPASIAFFKSGRLIPLGVTTVTRASALPEVPTIQESGVPGYEVSGWYGVIGPAAMPKALVARINREINSVLQVAETRDSLSKQGAEPRTATPEEFSAIMASDQQKWAKVVAAAGIKIR